MAEYRFKAGDLVRVQIGLVPKTGGALIGGKSKPLKGIYEVVQLVPVLADDEPRYVIKGYVSRVERVVRESFLILAPPFAQPRY